MFVRRTMRAVLLPVTMTASMLALTVCPLTASAAEDAKQHMGKAPSSMAQLMKMDPEECMKMMDKEHKGHVTKKAFMKFQEELWQKMDKNRDGRVDRVEFTDQG